MKIIIAALLIVVSISSGMGQVTKVNVTEIDLDTDTITANRFIEDSIGNSYEIEYHYLNTINFPNDEHAHYISLVNITAFKGNKQHTIAANIKAIYSPVECVSDNRELWLKRLYQIQKK